MTHDIYARMHEAVLQALPSSIVLNDEIKARIAIGPPRDPSHGDMTTNAAMVLANYARKKPRELASEISEALRNHPTVTDVSVAGPGFINLRLSAAAFYAMLPDILRAGEAYGDSTIGNGLRVNVEYVSANPTGPMHIGHCRGAVVGDALANLLAKAGYDVTKEYLHQRCRRAGHRARLGRLLALPASHRHAADRGAILRRSPRRPAIPWRIPDPHRRTAGRSNTAPRSPNPTAPSPPRKSGSTSCETSPSQQ